MQRAREVVLLEPSVPHSGSRHASLLCAAGGGDFFLAQTAATSDVWATDGKNAGSVTDLRDLPLDARKTRGSRMTRHLAHPVNDRVLV